MLILNATWTAPAQALHESDSTDMMEGANRADHALLLMVSYVAFATLVLAVVSALLA